ncbi:MAG: hypothetical protein WDN28_04415 [Chthoniobacter sp.]
MKAAAAATEHLERAGGDRAGPLHGVGEPHIVLRSVESGANLRVAIGAQGANVSVCLFAVDLQLPRLPALVDRAIVKVDVSAHEDLHRHVGRNADRAAADIEVAIDHDDE